MTFVPSPIARFVAEAVGQDQCVESVFAAADRLNLSMAEVINVLAEPFAYLSEDDAWTVEEAVMHDASDLLCAFVEYAGIERASSIAHDVALWRELDVERHYESMMACSRAWSALAQKAPIKHVLALSTDSRVPADRRRGLLQGIARGYELHDLATLLDTLTPDVAEVLRAELSRRLSPLTALETLAQELPSQDVLSCLEGFWRVRRLEGDFDAALVETYASLLYEASRPVSAAIALAERFGPFAWWLPLLRRQGYSASLAALFLLERGATPLLIATQLTGAGYGDAEVFRGLLENGLGPPDTLSALRDAGWNVARMVEALLARGVLLPEVRDRLDELRVARSSQRQLMLEQCDASLVDLVLGKDDQQHLLGPGSRIT